MATILLLILIYVSFISLGLPDALLGSAWPSMYEKMSVPISYAGILSMTISIGTVISSLYSAKVIKRFGTGIVTAVSVLMTAVALLGFSVSNNVIFLSIFAIPLGLGAGSVDAALNNYVALHYKARHMSWLHCFWGVGASISPLIMSSCLLNTGSWQSGYLIVGIIQICLVAILIFALPLWNKAHKTPVESDKVVKNSLKMAEILKIPAIKPALISFFCYCALEGTTGLWSSSYMVIEKGISPEIAARWTAIFYFGITFGRFLSGFLTIKLSNRQMVILGQTGILIGIISIILPFGNIFLMLGLFFIGLGCAPIYPSLLHETPKNFGSEHSQSVMGVQMAFAYIGATVMPPIFGMIATGLSYNLFPVYLVILLIIMTITTATVRKKLMRNEKYD